MTDRSDIVDMKPSSGSIEAGPRLSYTTKCGWIDWGHALPGGARQLYRDIQTEKATPYLNGGTTYSELDGKPAFRLDYNQSMAKYIFGNRISVGTNNIFVIRKGLPTNLKKQVTLSVFLYASHSFETYQGTGWRNFVSGDSSYSLEDLPSNMIGLALALGQHPPEGVRAACGQLSVEDSFRMWDHYIGEDFSKIKNHTATAKLFPVLDKDGNIVKVDTTRPAFLTTIKPIPQGRDWVAQRRMTSGPRHSRIIRKTYPSYDRNGDYKLIFKKK